MATLEFVHTVIRKAAHLTEYFIFGALLNRALRPKDLDWKLKWAIWAVILAAGYASIDEFHQSFVPSRTASPWDALLDTAGASIAQIFLWILHSFHGRNGEIKAISARTPTPDP